MRSGRQALASETRKGAMGVDTSKCSQIYEDGSSFKGQCKDGKFHGKGKMRWASGDSYEGHYCDGLMHGQGRYKHADGGRFHGQFSGNLREGYGVFTYGSGILYEGEWKEDKPDGNGRVLYPGGEMVNTKFKCGVQDMEGLDGQLEPGLRRVDQLALPPMPGTAGGLAVGDLAVPALPPPPLPALPDRQPASLADGIVGSASAVRLPMLPPPDSGAGATLSSVGSSTGPLSVMTPPPPLPH